MFDADLVCDNVSKTNGLSERCDVSNFRVNMSLPISSDLRSPASSDIQGVIKRTHENTSSKPKNGFIMYTVNIHKLNLVLTIEIHYRAMKMSSCVEKID